MMEVVLILFMLTMAWLFLFSLGQLHLSFKYLKSKPVKDPRSLNEWPKVTIQLPVYNEKYVITRLLDCINQIEYPADLLEIQILDDSTDETTDLIQGWLKRHKFPGSFIHIRRDNRKGFKAGALKYGLSKAKGEFIAIFDADFLPQADFLKMTLPHFDSVMVGVVQTRWGHINRNENLLTKIQAYALDAHFFVEQGGRAASNSFINFNGTGGIWRATCINSAGGWSDDTITEDLDLSFRAQLKGWRFKYVESIVCPAELPMVMKAVKSQQYRWNKGAAEVSRKLLGGVLHSNKPILNKIHALFHLTNSSVFLVLLAGSLLSVGMLSFYPDYNKYQLWLRLGNIFILGFLSIAFLYVITSRKINKKNWTTHFLTHFFPFIIVSMGLSWHNGMAAWDGWTGRKTPFIRTPKFNATGNSSSFSKNSYIKLLGTKFPFAEMILALTFGVSAVYGIFIGELGFVLLHSMLFLGFFIVSFLQIIDAL